ncbi:MAG: Ca-activated chloride channel family protein, partial [Paraglaciecola psychrophila]
MSTTEIINNLHLLRPLWLLGIVPALLLVWFFLRQRRRALDWRGAISPALLPHLLDSGENTSVARWRSHMPWYCLALGWVISCIALAGPSWEKLPQPVHQRQDALVIVLDLSLSMLAEDIQPARIVRARYKILDILTRRTEGLTALIA